MTPSLGGGEHVIGGCSIFVFNKVPSFARSVEVFDITVYEVFICQVFVHEVGNFSIRLKVGASVLPVRQLKRGVVEEGREELERLTLRVCDRLADGGTKGFAGIAFVC